MLKRRRSSTICIYILSLKTLSSRSSRSSRSPRSILRKPNLAASFSEPPCHLAANSTISTGKDELASIQNQNFK